MKFDNIFGYYSHETKEAVIYDGRKESRVYETIINGKKKKLINGGFSIPTLYRKKVTFETYKRNFNKLCNAADAADERKGNE
jgi:hypothetical protein